MTFMAKPLPKQMLDSFTIIERLQGMFWRGSVRAEEKKDAEIIIVLTYITGRHTSPSKKYAKSMCAAFVPLGV